MFCYNQSCCLPVIIHVDIEIVQTVQSSVAFDAVQWPKVILDLILVLAHRGVVVGRVRLGGRQRGLGHEGRLGQVVQGEPGLWSGLRLGRQSWRQDGGHLRLFLLDQSAQGEGKTEVREGSWIVESVVERLKLDCMSRLRLLFLLFATGKTKNKSH